MPRRKLPLLLERSISDTRALQQSLSQDFDQKIVTETTELKKPITCSKGCSSCCYHPVTISILEGVLLYRWLVRHGKWNPRLKKTLQESSDKQFGTTYQVWLLSLIPCPLLDQNGLCTAYEARPFNCRVYYATSDPHYCHPHQFTPGVTSIVSRQDELNAFHDKQEALLRNHNIRFTTMPIGAAILRGAQICEGEMDIDALDRVLFEEYVTKS